MSETPAGEHSANYGLLADVWEKGRVAGFSTAMRRMSDEPNAPSPVNPYKCYGHETCSAPLHVHGCYADVDGAACDDPGDFDARSHVISYVRRLIDYGKGYPDPEFDDATLEQIADRIIARVTASADPEPQPTDGPDYHADHAAWTARQTTPIASAETAEGSSDV